ncbi:MAG: hypothetical protein Q9166_006152 [cf. Caloplaca sp. 2 TL-2023]
MARPATELSPLEKMMQGKARPLSIIVHLFQPRYLECNPADQLMSLLPWSTILTLRAVSRTIKDWVHEYHPALLTSLRVTCPLPRFSTHSSSSTLRALAHDCLSLTIKVSPCAVPIPEGSILNPSPARQVFHFLNKFTTLRIEPPTTEAFQPLLSLRLALEAASLKTLKDIHIETLTIQGLLALRWGAFDAFKESVWMGETFWHGITNLRIGMASDWLKYAHQGLEQEHDEEKRLQMKEEREIFRQGIQIMHDWFFQFSVAGKLEKLCFEWVDGTGPNPLLLDEEVAKEEGGRWFSAPGIIWSGVREVWLGGVHIDTLDAKMLKQRFKGLEKLIVWEEMAESEIFGKVMNIAGRDWLDIDLAEFPDEPLGVELVNVMDDDRVHSMICTFILRL